MLPLQNNSKIVTDETGETKLVVDPTSVNAELDLTESFAVTAVDISTDTLTIAGDQRARFPAGSKFTIEGSTGNDGLYTADTVAYDSVGDETTIVTVEDVTDATVDGNIFIYELLLKPPVGVSVVLDSLRLLISERDATGQSVDANVDFEDGTLGQSLAPAVVSLTSATLNDIKKVSLGATERVITNSSPLYFRRIQADNGASLKAKVVLNGTAV